LADEGGPRTPTSESRGTRGRREPGPRAAARRAEADVERAVAALEQVVAAGRTSEIPRWTATLWEQRAAAERVLRRRLVQGPGAAPGLLLEVLAGLAGRRATGVLNEVANDADMPDLVRVEAHRRSGWPASGARRARAAFLRSLRDPSAALHGLVLLACRPAVPDGEIGAEALGYLLALPAAEREAWIAQSGGLYGPPASWLLRALLSAPDRDSRTAAAAQLLALRDRGAVPALSRLARAGRTALERDAAAVAQRRLAFTLLHGAGAPRRRGTEPAPGAAAPTVTAVLLSSVDGRGGQAATVVRAWTPDVRLVVQFSVPGDGDVEVRATMRASAAQADQLVGLGGRLESGLARITLPEARAFTAWGIERSLAGGHLPPPAFALWEPYLWEDLQPRPAEEAPQPLSLAGSAEVPGAAATAEFLESPPHASWQFGFAELAPALRDVADAETAGPARQALLLERLCAAPFPDRTAERLRRQAWVLDRLGEPRLRDVALGAACGLEAASPAEVAAQPLPRGMLARSLMGLRAARGRRGR
jgi:hypothetical protein